MAADEELQDCKNNMEQHRAAGGQSEDHYEQNIKPDSVIREDSDSLKKEIAKFKKTSEITLEKTRYLLADYDNYRKQMERQMEGKLEQAKGDVLSKIINIEDDFLRAINTLKDSRCSPSIVDGLNRILKSLNSLLLSEGVREIKALGTTFDPRVSTTH
jgi:molecular chaperone GrpE